MVCAAHLHTGYTNTHCSYDLQMVQDEVLQFSDATSLERATTLCVCVCVYET